MNKYNFTITGGFPFDQDVLNLLQDNIDFAMKSTSLFGACVILQGCTIVGTTASNGFVAINGEVLPFEGGEIQTKVRIVETPYDLVYEDGDLIEAKYLRVVRFGDDGVTTLLWSNFTRDTGDGILLRLLEAETALSAANLEIDGLNSAVALLAAEVDLLDATRAKKLASGLTALGNADSNNSDVGSGTVRRIFFGVDVGTTDYVFNFNVVSKSTNPQWDLYHVITERARSQSWIDLYFRESTTHSQNIDLRWIVLAQ